MGVRGKVFTSGPGTFELSALYPSAAAAAAPAADSEEDDRGDYVAIKIGPQWFTDDAGSDFDAGLYAEPTYGANIIGRFLSIQGSIGYAYNNADTIPGTEVEVQAAPFLIELRAAIPIAIFLPYAGVGLGGMYARADIKSPAPTGFDDDVVLAGCIFIGVNVELGPLFLGLEGKYVATDRSSNFETDFNFATVMESLGFRF